MKWVRDRLGMLTSSSQWMLLSCFSPWSIAIYTCFDRPSYDEWTGVQIAVEKRESKRT